MGRLDAAIATQTQEVFGREVYATLTLKAAAIVRGIISDHPFSDDDKRTAMLAGMTFLEINGLRVVAEQGEIEDFAVEVAVKRLDIKVIAIWLEAHTVKM